MINYFTAMLKFLILSLLFLDIIPQASLHASSFQVINDRLYLWETHRLEFGDYEFKLRNISLVQTMPNRYVINSSNLTCGITSQNLAVNTQVVLEDFGNYVKVSFLANFQQEHSFLNGFGAIITNINMKRIIGSNHAFERDYTPQGRRKLNLLNNLSFQTDSNYLNFFFQNPYHSFAVINPEEKFVYFQLLPEMKTRNSPTKVRPQENIRHIVENENSVYFEFFIAKSSTHGYINGIIENIYFSALPNGYTGGAIMMWDEIPMNFNERTFSTFTTKEKTSDWTAMQMLELFEKFPKYKASILLSFDYVCPLWANNSQLDLSRGLDPIDIRGPFDLATFAPDSFKQWLYNIENNLEYGWTNRTSLGFHSLHHTYIDNGVILEQKFHEFDVYDSLQAVRAFDRVFSELDDLRLTKRSMRFLRYPGHKNSEAILHETSRRGFRFTCLSSPHDYDIKDEFNISRILTGRDNYIWTFKTASWTDVGVGAWEDIYRITPNRVATGKPLLLGGHPNATLGMHAEQSYMVDIFHNYIHSLYASTENFGFMLADSFTYFLEEFYNLGEIQYNILQNNNINITINSPLTNNQTLVLDNNFASQFATFRFNGQTVHPVKREQKTYLTLPQLYANSTQNVVSMLKLQDNNTLEEVAIQGIKAIHLDNQFIITTAVSGDYELFLYNIRGQTIARKKFNGLTQHIDLQQFASGIYFARITLNNKNILKQKIFIVK